jgi:hypothetical protein
MADHPLDVEYLRQIFQKYGFHLPTCPKLYKPRRGEFKRGCRCGFEDACKLADLPVPEVRGQHLPVKGGIAETMHFLEEAEAKASNQAGNVDAPPISHPTS